jgi:general secretion pathway protein N
MKLAMTPAIKSGLKFGGLGLAIYLVFLIVLFPASLGWKLSPASLKQQVQLSGIQGRIWNGSASSLVINRNALGSIDWTLNPWSLIMGSASGSFKIDREPELLAGNYSVSGMSTLELSNIEARIQGESLEPLTTPFLLHGSITASFDTIRYKRGEEVGLKGVVKLRNTFVEGLQDIQLGDVTAEVRPDGTGSVATFKNQASPLDIQGKVDLDIKGLFNLELGILNQDNKRKDLDNMLAVLGKPDISGRVTLNYKRRIRLP